SRAAAAARLATALRRGSSGASETIVLPFAATLESDTSQGANRSQTAIGDALEQLAGTAMGQRATSVALVSDGAANAGSDPVAAARALGLPVHTIAVGEGGSLDRVVTGIEAPNEGRVGQSEPVRVHLASSEPRGQSLPVRLFENGREIAHGQAIAPGP